jgi:hypothetical protein
MLLIRLLLFLLALIGTMVLAGCDSARNEATNLDCNSRTSNSMAARVNGKALCTDLGTALLLDVPGPRLSVVGLFATSSPGGSISFNVANPGVGTFDLTDPTADNDAMYGQEDETAYFVDRTEGSGSVTISELTDTRVKGTFAFTGVGYDINDNRTGDEAEVTDGAFDFALGTPDFSQSH